MPFQSKLQSLQMHNVEQGDVEQGSASGDDSRSMTDQQRGVGVELEDDLGAELENDLGVELADDLGFELEDDLDVELDDAEFDLL